MAPLAFRHAFTIVSTAALCACGAPAMRGAPPDIDSLTATEAAARLCGGTLSSEALTQAYLARAKSRPELNAFVTLDEAGALKAAREADQKRAAGGRCLPLQGLPIVVKDNIQTRGLPTTAGTPALKNAVAAADAPVMKKLRDAGAVLLGKTNMHELAFGISGYNPAYNTGANPGVRNAYDSTRMAGGSSSGTAAALGARMAPAGLGTDTGGSVRIPCALNGCASLRPTVGRYPQAGIVPISHTRDTAGPMALSMADVELLDRVITDTPAVTPIDLKTVRLGMVPSMLDNLDADTRDAFEKAMGKLKAAGVTVADLAMPQLKELNGKVSFPVAFYEAYDDLVAYLASYAGNVSIAQVAEGIVSPDVKGAYQGLVLPRKLPAGPSSVIDSAPIYRAAITVDRPALIRLYATTFANRQLDALVFPTVPHVAPPATRESSSLENFLLFIQNTDPGSNAGVPGIQLPMGFGASTRMPVGMELDGPAGSDRRLIAIGMAIESVLGRLAPAR